MDRRKKLFAANVTSALEALFNGTSFYAPLADAGDGAVSLVASGAGASQAPTFTRATDATTFAKLDDPYLSLLGVSGNYASTPNSSALSLTGDLEVIVDVAPQKWTSAPSDTNLAAKYEIDGNQRSWVLTLRSDGYLQYLWNSTGLYADNNIVASTAAITFSDNERKRVKVTHKLNNGAGGNDVEFFTADPSGAWAQLGTTVTTAGVATIYSSTAPFSLGDIINGILLTESDEVLQTESGEPITYSDI